MATIYFVFVCVSGIVILMFGSGIIFAWVISTIADRAGRLEK